MNEIEEVWKPVIYKGIDYTGRFKVSNLGRIRSLYFKEPRIQQPVLGTNGYCECSFPRPDGKYNYTTVHRIVMLTFNPVEGAEHLEVNHKDECKTNNRLDNLEWCTCAENCNYGSRNKKIGAVSSKPVLHIETRAVYRNQTEACKAIGCAADIMSVHLDRKQRHIHGNHFARIPDYFPKDHVLTDAEIDYIVEKEIAFWESQPVRRTGPIQCVETGKVYSSQTEASKDTGILQPLISEALRGLIRKAGRYTWIHID